MDIASLDDSTLALYSTTTTETTGDGGYLISYNGSGGTTYQSATVKCKRVWSIRTKTNGAWVKLWRYGQQQSFCWKTTTNRISSLYGWRDFHEVYGPGWEWVSRARYTNGFNLPKWNFETRVEGHIKFCILGYGCLAHKYPWVTIGVYGNGGWSHAKGGFSAMRQAIRSHPVWTILAALVVLFVLYLFLSGVFLSGSSDDDGEAALVLVGVA